MRNQKITGIMACDPSGVIGLKKKLPWHYPEEVEFYRKATHQQCMIMGHKTFNEMREEFLENHYSIIFSKKTKLSMHKNVVFVSSINEFKKINFPVKKRCYMIGGAELATFFLKNNLIDDFLLTIITKKYIGDTFFNLESLVNWPRTLIKQSDEFSIYHYINPQSDL